MSHVIRAAVLLWGWGLFAGSARAQLLADTLFAWKGYAQTSHCRLRLYVAAEAVERPRIVVLEELADNRGPSTLDDARYLAERVGRALNFDPADALWVFHWGAFSFPDARPDAGKELFLRATFRRSRQGQLGTPTWRVVRREDVEEYTDRRFR